MKKYEIEIQVSELTPTESEAVIEALNDITNDGNPCFYAGLLIINGCIDVPTLMTERQIFDGIVRDIGEVVGGKRISVSGHRIDREPDFMFSTEDTCQSP